MLIRIGSNKKATLSSVEARIGRECVFKSAKIHAIFVVPVENSVYALIRFYM